MKNKIKTEEHKPRFKTNYNGFKSITDYEKVDPVSITVPNETFSLKDIVEKFTREYPKEMLRTGYYDEINDENPDFDDIDITRSPEFDLVDAYELKENIKQKHKDALYYKAKTEKPLINSNSEKNTEKIEHPSDV